MTTLLIAEHDNAHLSGETAKALSAASQLGAPVHILVAVSYTHLTLPTICSV